MTTAPLRTRLAWLGGLSFASGLPYFFFNETIPLWLAQEGMSLVLAGALISIALNPLLFACVKPLKELALRRSDYTAVLAREGFDGLVASLRGKIADLAAGRAKRRA